MNKLVQAEPDNAEAKDLLADIFEQIGYQQENPGLRNSFLAAAYELRTGIPQGETANSSSPDVIRAMSTELFLNFLGIRMDSRKAEGLRFTINLVTPDNGEKFIIEMENATLTNIAGLPGAEPRPDADHQPVRPRADDDGREDARGADRRRHREGGGRRRRPRASSPRPWSTSIRASRSCPAPRRGQPTRPPSSRPACRTRATPIRPCRASRSPSRGRGARATARHLFMIAAPQPPRRLRSPRGLMPRVGGDAAIANPRGANDPRSIVSNVRVASVRRRSQKPPGASSLLKFDRVKSVAPMQT